MLSIVKLIPFFGEVLGTIPDGLNFVINGVTLLLLGGT